MAYVSMDFKEIRNWVSGLNYHLVGMRTIETLPAPWHEMFPRGQSPRAAVPLFLLTKWSLLYKFDDLS